MWAIRFLTGKHIGQVMPLKSGSNILGRGPSCDITINSPSISKEHAQIDIYPDKIIISDLGSRNGTFINGIQIKAQKINVGDKVSLHELIFEIVPAHFVQQQQPIMPTYPQPTEQPPAYDNNLAYQQQADQQFQPNFEPQAQAQNGQQPQGQVVASGLAGIKQIVINYFEKVVLPGVYKLPEIMEFKWVLGLFMGLFIILVTTLSAVPLVQILKDSIEKESQRRALTIARMLASDNAEALKAGLESAVNINIIQKEEGVAEALIISAIDGKIIAPAVKAGSFPDLPFVHSARKLGREAVEQINSDSIGALVPIAFYNSSTGSQSVSAYSVIIYNMNSLAVNDERTLSLYIQTFFIALIIGSILFFFLYRIIVFPITSINKQLDVALKEGSDQISTSYQFPPLIKLVSNISSALNRALTGGSSSSNEPMFEYDRNNEMANLVQMMGFPCIAISAHDRIISASNDSFIERTGIQFDSLINAPVESITDQALRLSINDLVERVEAQPDQIANNEIEFSGESFEIVAQSIYGQNKVAYYVVVLLPAEEVYE